MQKILQRPEMRVAAVVLGAALIFSMFLSQPRIARADTSVSAVDNSFSQKIITIAPGETVTWTNNGTMPHTVTADNGSYNSGTLNSGASFSHTFTTAGIFPYYCSFHGAAGGVGMSGTVIVDASLSSASSTSNSTSTAGTTSSTSTTSTSTTTTTGTSTSATTTSAAPVLTNGLVTPNNTGAVITWTTNVNSNAQVSYGVTSAYTTTTASDVASSTSHTVILGGLMPGILYHFMAISSANGVRGMSPDETFTTTNSVSSTTTGTSTATTAPTGTGTGTSTATSTQVIDLPGISAQITHLESLIKALQMQVQMFFQNRDGGGTPFPPMDGNGGPGTSTEGTAVYADNYSVGPSNIVQLRGTGFGANETVNIMVNGIVIGTIHSDQNGAFTVSRNASNTEGDTTYWFTGATSGKTDSVMISVETGNE